ncbi:MAG: ATP-dependent DNA ligase [Candidatus Hodarchaeota archaeon]
MKFLDFCRVMEQIDSTSKKSEKIQIFASFLRELPVEELEPACYFAIGEIFSKKSEKRIQMGGSSFWSVIRQLTSRSDEELRTFYRKKADFGSLVEWALLKFKPQPQSLTVFFEEQKEEKNLSIYEIRNLLTELASIKGKGSVHNKKNQLLTLLKKVSPLEAKYIARIITSDTRTGFQEGLLLEAIGLAFERSLEQIRYGYMILGDLGELILTAKDPTLSLNEISPRLFYPLRSMLATKVESVDDALAAFSPIICEQKIDGFRAQLHVAKNQCRIYSRNLENVTKAFPEITESISPSMRKEISPSIIDGEMVAIVDNKPVFFQDLLTRIKRKSDVVKSSIEVPAYFFAFDILLYKGKSLLRTGLKERKKILDSIETSDHFRRLSFIELAQPEEIQTLYQEAMENGFEGLMLKDPRSLYLAGKRGKSWLKLKGALPTLDLVIIGAEWGHGRRTGWLSNYHLAARDENKFQIVGKTFKGLTDKEFIQLTEDLQALAITDESYGVQVQPQIVVEVEFDNIQESAKYPSGMALRFARIKRIRNDKNIEDVDTISTVKELYKSQLKRQRRARKV